MRTGKIEIGGKPYIICFSSRVAVALEEKFGSIENAFSSTLTSDLMWMLATMIDAGDRYAKLEGIENTGKLTMDEILDKTGPEDYNKIFSFVLDAVKKGGETEIETVPNTKTTL